MNIDATFPGLVNTRKGYVFKGNIEAPSLRVFVGPLLLDGSLLVEGDVSAQFGIETTGEIYSEGKIEAGHLKSLKITAREIESYRGLHSKSDIVCEKVSAESIVVGGTFLAKRISSKNHLCASFLKCGGDVDALSIDIEKDADIQGIIRTFWGFTAGSCVTAGGFFSESIHIGGDLHVSGDLLVLNEIRVRGKLEARYIFGGNSLSVGASLNVKEIHGLSKELIRIGEEKELKIQYPEEHLAEGSGRSKEKNRLSLLGKLFSWPKGDEFNWEY